jgi:hypothetical protein
VRQSWRHSIVNDSVYIPLVATVDASHWAFLMMATAVSGRPVIFFALNALGTVPELGGVWLAIKALQGRRWPAGAIPVSDPEWGGGGGEGGGGGGGMGGGGGGGGRGITLTNK